jgi:hypothetical protein
MSTAPGHIPARLPLLLTWREIIQLLYIFVICPLITRNENLNIQGGVSLVNRHNDIELYRCICTDTIQNPLFVRVLSQRVVCLIVSSSYTRVLVSCHSLKCSSVKFAS